MRFFSENSFGGKRALTDTISGNLTRDTLDLLVPRTLEQVGQTRGKVS